MSDKAVADQAAACLFRQDPFIWGEGPLDLLYPEEGDLYITLLKASDLIKTLKGFPHARRTA
ncbi:hypothetical protein [Paenibacillus amylolyticus]|uniref:hypothetical protein n=1 Tax=Paenibacillus amylolyticus TaxID=1451 RepID=UPI00158CD783|nr:hypothetical protein [Paenibacillus amylolyticus]